MMTFFLCYYYTGDSMNQNVIKEDFGLEDTYKLYRTVYEIIHPTISKKNISNYKIIIQENLLPLRIFYPKKISKIERVIIYIHGKRWMVNGFYSYKEVCERLVQEMDSLVIAIDYENDSYQKVVDKSYQTIKCLKEGLNRIGIQNIIAIGDALGASILSNVVLIDKSIIKKEILLYPALDFNFKIEYPSLTQNNKLDLLTIPHLHTYCNKYINLKKYHSVMEEDSYKDWPDTLVITGDLDPLRDEIEEFSKRLRKDNRKSKYINIKFASHGFLNSKDEEAKEECFKDMKNFIISKRKVVIPEN